jgi:hypothetical protein
VGLKYSILSVLEAWIPAYEESWPHERRCPEEAVAAAEAALGAGEDEAEGEGGVGQASGQVTGGPAGTLST